MIIDELPSIYFRGLDNLIATARSNKVAVCLGFQDFSLCRNYELLLENSENMVKLSAIKILLNKNLNRLLMCPFKKNRK
ncbi:hypothetical protein CCAN12_340005 [Capnocytophaga canimorsus]|uniref:TraD/TraG TraM recognition site domain-containing protein n=1 Tax=Capnocytophaga canimorsus TaxID=28188 RepID=A0A0B7H165_9FLAO|nr:hypothetical protein CCAN12_340005 [Capnocytophaga canimorsus]